MHCVHGVSTCTSRLAVRVDIVNASNNNTELSSEWNTENPIYLHIAAPINTKYDRKLTVHLDTVLSIILKRFVQIGVYLCRGLGGGVQWTYCSNQQMSLVL